MNAANVQINGRTQSSLTGEGAIRYGDNDPKLLAGLEAEPVFTSSELEQLCFRRYNPFAQLNARNLALALDQFDSGVLMYAARYFQQIINRDDTIPSIKSKREEAVSLRSLAHTPVDESQEAADQAAALEMFYRNVRAGHALNRHTTGGTPLLLSQMMESVAFLWAAHHIVWQPDAGTQWKLPSGKEVPALTALFEYVPLEFFEARTGELRFLGMSLGFTGEELAPGNWLVTTGPGLMRAAASIFYFKRLADHDMVNFSEKFGQPGIEVETTGSKDSPEGEAARDLARQLAANWRGVRYGSDKNGVNFLWPEGGVSGTELPMHTIKDDAKRSLAVLWLGADLSTMSRGGNEKAVGSLAQEDEREKRERADCTRMSETFQASVDPMVIEWFFGEGTPVLAKTTVEMPINEDRSLLANLTQQMVNQGAEVPISPVMKRLGVPEAKEGEKTFQPAQQAEVATPDSPEEAVNAATLQEMLAMSDEEFEVAVNALAGNANPYHGQNGRFASAPDQGGAYTGQAAKRNAENEIKANIQRGVNAMRRCSSEQTDVLAAMRRDGVGDVDFVWERDGLGVKHIIDRREAQDIARPGANKLSPDELLEKIPEAIARGEIKPTRGNIEINHDGVRVILAKSKKSQSSWLVTGYEPWPGEERKGNR